MFRKVLVLALGLTVVCAGAYAYDYNAGSKLGRGVANGATGWIDLPKQIYLESVKENPFHGLFYGGAKGVCDAVLRTVTGAYDIAFFLLPPYDKPFMEPEFVFEGWEAYKE